MNYLIILALATLTLARSEDTFTLDDYLDFFQPYLENFSHGKLTLKKQADNGGFFLEAIQPLAPHEDSLTIPCSLLITECMCTSDVSPYPIRSCGPEGP